MNKLALGAREVVEVERLVGVVVLGLEMVAVAGPLLMEFQVREDSG